jgi:hypothetical protein
MALALESVATDERRPNSRTAGWLGYISHAAVDRGLDRNPNRRFFRYPYPLGELETIASGTSVGIQGAA